MPNTTVYVNYWVVSACYPQGNFYPLSDDHSILHRLITKSYFRICSTCWSRSQAPLYLYALRMISKHSEGTFERLRYSLGGDRPSQTAHLTLSPGLRPQVRTLANQEWYPNIDSIYPERHISQSPTYPVHDLPEFNIKLQ